MYYAIEHAYGATMINRGQRPNLLIRFPSAASRDHWVQRGAVYFTEAGYREACGSRHPYVRYAQRHPEQWDDDGRGLRYGTYRLAE